MVIREILETEVTADCDVAHFAGAPTETFQQGNILAAWYYSLGQRGYKLNVVGVADIPEDQKTEGNKVPQLVPGRSTGLSGEELSKMMQLSHAATLEHLRQHRQTDGSLIPTAIATIPQVRMTRRLRGDTPSMIPRSTSTSPTPWAWYRTGGSGAPYTKSPSPPCIRGKSKI